MKAREEIFDIPHGEYRAQLLRLRRPAAGPVIIPHVAAIIPVYNHERAVPAVATTLQAHGLTLVLVDDGSGEVCRLALEKLARDTGAHLVRLPVNGGKGAAVIAGLRKARELGFTHALQVDADGQHDLRDVPKFLDNSRRQPDAVICATGSILVRNIP